jgi:hypothetical protein
MNIVIEPASPGVSILKIEEIRRQQKEQNIQRMEQEKREALLAKELEELNKPPPPEHTTKKTPRGRSEKQKLRAEVLNDVTYHLTVTEQ